VAGWAQAAIDAAAALDAGITSLQARRTAVLRVAASMTVAEYLPGWLTRCVPATRTRRSRDGAQLDGGGIGGAQRQCGHRLRGGT